MSAPMVPIVPQGVPLGALASALEADRSGAMKRELLTLFGTAGSEARRRLHEPLMPEDHDAASALAQATRECVDVVEAVWNALHP